MKIKTHFGMSLDGFISSPDGWPAQLSMPNFAGADSYGHPEFIAGCTAVAMGRTTFEPALGAPDWPWPGLRVFVLTSQPLPDGTPEDVVAASTPQDLLAALQAADLGGDVHLVGGQRTLDAFLGLGAVDSLGVYVLPILFGDGVRLTTPTTDRTRLRLESSRPLADGAIEHIYTPLTT